MDPKTYKCAILTISDKGSRGERQDTSGPQLQNQLGNAGFNIVSYVIVPDQQELIRETILKWVDEEQIDLIVTTGGTGLSPSDRTPEATRPLLDFEIPGIPESLRAVHQPRRPEAARPPMGGMVPGGRIFDG